MLDAAYIREHADEVKQGVAAKNVDPGTVDAFLKLDEAWRKLTKEADELLALQNQLSKEKKIEEAKANKEKVKAKETERDALEVERKAAWRAIPNVPLPHVVRGKSEAENVVLREVGQKPAFDFVPQEYLGLATRLGLIDMERGAKVSGSRFGYILGDLARMEFALGQMIFDALSNRETLRAIAETAGLAVSDTPFVPVIPPVLVGEDAMRGMGYLDRGADEVYHFEKDNLYLVGTSEQVIGPMHQNETFDPATLPRRYVGFSPCFRREAGSYGKDTKGILRVHQFDKFEMFSITTPEASNDEHLFLLAIEEFIMQKLGLPYHVLNICSADLGDPAAAKFDIEAWMPGQPSSASGQGNGGKGEYRETHSTSNTTDYQSRRLNIRMKTPDGLQFVHMLNGTACAVGRMLIAIIENYQTADGTIRVPDVLRQYLGKERIG